MSSVSEVVEAAFSDVSFGLNDDHRLELVTIIDMQVNGLLRQYLEDHSRSFNNVRGSATYLPLHYL